MDPQPGTALLLWPMSAAQDYVSPLNYYLYIDITNTNIMTMAHQISWGVHDTVTKENEEKVRLF